MKNNTILFKNHKLTYVIGNINKNNRLVFTITGGWKTPTQFKIYDQIWNSNYTVVPQRN